MVDVVQRGQTGRQVVMIRRLSYVIYTPAWLVNNTDALHYLTFVFEVWRVVGRRSVRPLTSRV